MADPTGVRRVGVGAQRRSAATSGGRDPGDGLVAGPDRAYPARVSFDVPPDAYDRFMGRYSGPLARAFADLVAPTSGQRALDVGCGPGQLTEVLVERLGTRNVSAVDPSPPFVAALVEKLPELDVRLAPAEDLPHADAVFDLTLAQLVVQFMADPVAGLAEMGRVTRPGGVVAASVWDHSTGGGPLTTFWRAVQDLDPSVPGESGRAGVDEGHLAELFGDAGMTAASSTILSVYVEHATFEEWWDPYLLGVGPAGQHVAGLDEHARAELRERCRARLPEPPFTVGATAWTVWWRKPDR